MRKINPFLLFSILVLLATGCGGRTCGPQSDDELAQQYGLKLLLADAIRNDQNIRYVVQFTSDKQLELPAGRRFAIPLVDDFIHMQRSRTDDNPNRLGLKIDFWNNEVNRPQKPYLAQITFSQGMFYYYVADPSTEALRLVLKEPYKAAIENSKYDRVNYSRIIWDQKETDKDLPPTWRNSWITPLD